MSGTRVIIISHLPIPYNGVGSWTNSYSKYLESKKTLINHIVCPKFENNSGLELEYSFYENDLINRLKSKIFKNRFYSLLKALDKIILKNEGLNFVIQIVDNFGLINFINDHLKKNKKRNKVYLQYAFHGFLLNIDAHRVGNSFKALDEIIFLTKMSYQAHLNKFSILPKNVSVLHNGINAEIFNRQNRTPNPNKTIFLWCSQDRPKKGLHIILDIWEELHVKYQNTELWIVGTHKTIIGKGIKCFGRIENQELPNKYKQADVYLFPTLWQEGFGLTLAEALHCGCFCIASNLGGIPEVLNNGEYGWLIDEPHNSEKWFKAMEEYILTKPKSKNLPELLYSLDNWCKNINTIIQKAVYRLENKSN
jgi:glycosyltransferase involved in cell wall biosynthesis